ncbi:hypothetical protein QBC46DRAFT_271313 [Diplogelasinospora grovesii]|uniref:Uncharacterized protein n=1 Tax=Diplogelasinospora grovesii TaxID=303347 RepID=A0AAN6RZI1_9PEZI|nr:hypothetical protein QBC46DRAFT_271313 [Diplogelasinospora grovesii]
MFAMTDAPGLHRCPVCFKTYKRREHLQRHRSSHTSERPHRCILCNASFQRTDVLKRHLQTCDAGSNASSSRRRACDRCVRQKKACSAGHPCQNCEKRTVLCKYSNLNTSGSNAAVFRPATAGPSGETSETNANARPEPSAPNTNEDAASSFEDVPYDDLDALIQAAVSGFPVLEVQAVPDDWLDVGFSSTAAATEPFQQEASASGTSSSPASEYRGYSFSYLYIFTSRTGLVSSFDCATLTQRQQIVSSFHQAYLTQQHPELLGALPPLFTPTEEWPRPGHPLTGGPPDHGLTCWTSWLHNPIIIKLQQVVLLVKNAVTDKPNNSTVSLTWSPALQQRCLHFFSPWRFAKFIELYWSVWHPNVNFLHRPTFDPTSSKSILLAAMALIGACVSPDPEDNEDARMWFNCVEEMVFTDNDFCSDAESSSSGGEFTPPASVLASRRKLQALQAAYIVCLYQNWEGTVASKRRIRRQRFSTVVSFARDLGIDTARHLDYSRRPKHEFNWNEYVVREEMIRTFTWIFLLDTAFVIFNNLPHRMVIKEMKMHMASPEACFQATTAKQCIEEIHRWMSPSSPFCSILLREAIEDVCSDTMGPDLQDRFSQLGPLNLFAIVSAFHYMIFQHQNLFGVEGQLVPIRTGLRNWIAIWEQYVDLWSSSPLHGMAHDDRLAPEMMWKRVGFIRHSPEYWLLGRLLTDRISRTIAKDHDPSQGRSPPGSSSEEAASGRAHSKSVEPILDKYDQTSMRQVNDLITAFQDFHVD